MFLAEGERRTNEMLGITQRKRPLQILGIVLGLLNLLLWYAVPPWLARGVFPIVYTLGFVVIPFLVKPASDLPARACGIAVAILLLSFEAVWLFLIFVGVFCRGPNWNFYWPWEPWELRVELYNPCLLSDYVWIRWFNRSDAMEWGLRELPGFVLIGGYFLSGFVVARVLYRFTERATRYWRWAVLVIILQLASIVPIKMLLRWLFNIKYVIYLPEYDLNL